MESEKPSVGSDRWPELRLPEPLTEDDRLFPEHREWATASIEWRRSDWWAFALAYKRAADTLSKAAETSPSADDTFVLPALFLYRHYLELQMKWLIRRAAQIVGRTDFQPHHNLIEQWRQCDDLLMQAIPRDASVAQPEMQHVERIVREMAKVDPNSFAFRYPEGKDGRAALPSAFTHVTMRNVREVMDKVDVMLSGAAECLEQRVDFLSEYESFDPGVYEHPKCEGP